MKKALLSHDKPVAGVLTPLFALHHAGDIGCGNLAALREFIGWAADNEFRCVQLLPVNETGGDHSPYNAISSVALEPTTVDVTILPDLSPEERQEIEKAHSASDFAEGPVQWVKVKALQRALLLRSFQNFSKRPKGDALSAAFAAFTEAEKSWLESYALFRVLMERHGSEYWPSWPEEVRHYAAAANWLGSQPAKTREEMAQLARFCQYVQWVAFTQWREAKRYADERGVLLMGDIPFGVNFSSADVWAQPDLFDLQWSGGAPPEPAFADDLFVVKWGQNWGVPLYQWPKHRASNFAWWRQRVRKTQEAFHLFRIDHVLGFFRIYGFPWRPDRNAEFAPLSIEEAKALTGGVLPHFHEHSDDTPEHKEANRVQGEEFLKVLLDEVGQNALVGEDLGTVPDYVRPCLHSLGVPGFQVPQWESDKEGRLTPANEFARCSVATYATHDHDPLRVMWDKWMAVIRAALDEPERLAEQRDHAWFEVRRIAGWAGFEVPRILPFEEVHEGFVSGLFRTNAWLAVLMITDLLGTSQRFNVPGTVGAANWSARLPGNWQSEYAEKVSRVAALIRDSGRTP